MSDLASFRVTPGILNAVARISERIGEMSSLKPGLSPKLRRRNRAKSIAGSLAIEGNSLSEEQVTAMLDGRPVIGSALEVAEVKGAIAAYEQMQEWDGASLKDLLTAHAVMMGDVLKNAGKLRTTGVGIQKGDTVLHIAPPADRVRGLLNRLLKWCAESDYHPLVTSSVFHYEFEFIHPFPDGNGRLGRLWQTRLLADWNPLFYHLPLESVIHDHQQNYYDALSGADRTSDSTGFIEFMLDAIEKTLLENAPLSAPANAPLNVEDLKTPDAVLACVAHDAAMTRKEMAEKIGKDVRTIARAIRKLRQEGRLRRVGSDKTGIWQAGE